MPSKIPEIPIRKSDFPTQNQEQPSKDYQKSERKKNLIWNTEVRINRMKTLQKTG